MISGGLLSDRKASVYDHASWISFHYINLIQTQDALSYWDSGLLLEKAQLRLLDL